MKNGQTIVVISRADSTLGRRIAHILARHGADIILLYRNIEPTIQLVEEIYEDGGDCVMISLEGNDTDDLDVVLHNLKTTLSELPYTKEYEHSYLYIC